MLETKAGNSYRGEVVMNAPKNETIQQKLESIVQRSYSSLQVAHEVENKIFNPAPGEIKGCEANSSNSVESYLERIVYIVSELEEVINRVNSRL